MNVEQALILGKKELKQCGIESYSLDTVLLLMKATSFTKVQLYTKNTVELMKEYTNTIKQISNIPLDVHLMVEDVKEHINEYISFEPNIITFHLEAVKSKEVKELINMIKEAGIKVRNISKTKNKYRRYL